MTHSNLPGYPYGHKSAIFRALLIALAVLPAGGCNKDDQQASNAPVPPAQSTPPTAVPPAMLAAQVPAAPAPLPTPAASPLSDLESLVAPIALYPDPLLAELLVASTYPLEVVQAARWLETKPDLNTLPNQEWDASVQRLTSVPTVLTMMSDHLDWTTKLGDTFLAQPKETMDTIQTLRQRAKDAGFLKDTPEQKVASQKSPKKQKELISITPAKADSIYVPQYRPEVVYQAPITTAGYSPNYYPAPTGNYAPNGYAPNYAQSGYPAPATNYAPNTYPAPVTNTGSTDSGINWTNLAAGAVVGGLLTWGIMEWADDDDEDNYIPVGHYYGNNVCRRGNCWSGGGRGGRYGGNYSKTVNIDRTVVYNQASLKPLQQPARWQPDPLHRRGQPIPKAAQHRFAQQQQLGLDGRTGTGQGFQGSAPGLDSLGQRPDARRPSTADIQQQLLKKPGKNKHAKQDLQNTLGGQGVPVNSLQGGQIPGKQPGLAADNQEPGTGRAGGGKHKNKMGKNAQKDAIRTDMPGTLDPNQGLAEKPRQAIADPRDAGPGKQHAAGGGKNKAGGAKARDLGIPGADTGKAGGAADGMGGGGKARGGKARDAGIPGADAGRAGGAAGGGGKAKGGGGGGKSKDLGASGGGGGKAKAGGGGGKGKGGGGGGGGRNR